MNARIQHLAISESGFVFDPFSGGTFSVNSTGRAILEGLREGLAEPEIVRKLETEFEHVTTKLEDDVREFLRTMADYGLLVET